MATKINLRPLHILDINEDYCSWYENNDGHLNYFSGSGRIFNRNLIVRDYEDGINSGRWYYYIIEDEAGEKIGNVKIGPIDIKNKTSDLVCLVGNRMFLGKGIASQAIALANIIAFEKHDIRRLQSGMYAENIASIKAYTKAGWVVESIFKGFYLVDGASQDRVCVACFNPSYFQSAK